MDFISGWKFYFEVILDVTTYVSSVLFMFALWLLIYPKKWDKLTVVHRCLFFVLMYSFYVWLYSPFFFALSQTIPSMEVVQLFFSFAPSLYAAIFILIFFRQKRTHKVLVLAMAVSQVLVVGATSKNMGFFAGGINPEVNAAIILARTAPFVLCVFTGWMIRFCKIHKYPHIPKEMVIIIFTIGAVLIGVGIFQHLNNDTNTSVAILLSTIDIILILLMNFVFYASIVNVKNRRRITELEVKANLAVAEREAVRIDQANREELQKLRHDLKNHLNYLNIMLDKGDIEGAKNYLKDYQTSKMSVVDSYTGSNTVLNAIVNLALTKAKIAGIEIDVKTVVPPSLPFSKTDMVSLITNMIDNAIENYYSEKSEKIELRVFKQNDYIRFICRNPVDVKKVNLDHPTRSKKKENGHGYGTKIIKSIASSYGGYSSFSVEGNQFTCDAVLDLNSKGEEHA